MVAANLYREPRPFFTSPWDPVVVRRGDALGLRALADRFADALVPDLSNRIRDGRWVTILAWCLVRSQERYRAIGGHAVLTRAEQVHRYAWLRPLELMWVARTIALAKDWTDRPLAGQRRVRRWYNDDKQSTERLSAEPENPDGRCNACPDPYADGAAGVASMSHHGRAHASLCLRALSSGDVWTWTAIDADTKLFCVSYLVGGRDAGYGG
jgi:hypothetical protein